MTRGLEKISYYTNKAPSVLRERGVRGFLGAARNAASRMVFGRPYEPPRQPFYCQYVREVDFRKGSYPRNPQRETDSDRLVINWIVPDFGIGSGGHMTIFRTIAYLEKFGHKNTIYLCGDHRWAGPKEAKGAIDEHFIHLEAELRFGLDGMEDCDALFATSWWTAYAAYNIPNAKEKFYFVQDFEPSFYPMSSEYVLAENTYRFGFKCVTAGPWLAKILSERYGAQAAPFELAYEKDVYSKASGTQRDDSVVFYARHVTPRRGFELALMALELVREKHPQTKIIFYGWDHLPYELPFEVDNRGILSHAELAELFSRAGVALVLSLTNYSLLPQEMMACGMPVVDVRGDNTVAVFGDANDKILLADPDPHSIADALCSLLESKDKREGLSAGALKYVKDLDWERSARKVEAAIRKFVTGEDGGPHE